MLSWGSSLSEVSKGAQEGSSLCLRTRGAQPCRRRTLHTYALLQSFWLAGLGAAHCLWDCLAEEPKILHGRLCCAPLWATAPSFGQGDTSAKVRSKSVPRVFPCQINTPLALRFRPNRLNMVLNSCHHLRLLILLCCLTGRYEVVRNQRHIFLGWLGTCTEDGVFG